jgi:hypothetical protein
MLTRSETKRIMKTSVSATVENGSEGRAGNGNETDLKWQHAGDRIFLYLRCLNFPARAAFELALEALKAADRSLSEGAGSDPAAEAMRSLRLLLDKRESGAFGHHSSAGDCRRCPIPAAPPLRRLHMVPEGIGSVRRRLVLSSLLHLFR